MLESLQGILCLMNNILDNISVDRQDKQEHNKRLETVLQRIQSAGVTLNSDKCKFSKDQLIFLGRIIGIRVDPAKIQAILNLSPPSNVLANVSVCYNDQPTSQVS